MKQSDNDIEHKGSMLVNGYTMSWIIVTESKKGIFNKAKKKIKSLKIYKNNQLTAEIYGKNKKLEPLKEDDESYICINYALNQIGMPQR